MSIIIQAPKGKDTKARAKNRAALAHTLWNEDGSRRLPKESDLLHVMAACTAKDIWWVCEASSAGPLYFLPTQEWMGALASFIDRTKAKTILEVAAGDGFLSACVSRVRPKLRVIATDDNSWKNPRHRMNARDRKEFGGVVFSGITAGEHVEKLGAVAAVKKHRPDLTIIAWSPPGTLVERVIRAPSQLVMDISVDGDVCGNGMRTWRFEKEFLSGPLEDRALCRLDARPRNERASRVTLYYGAAHKKHAIDKQFRLLR